VIDRKPTPQEARAALAEASRQAAGVRRADQLFRWILLGIAACYIGAGVVVSIGGRHAGPLAAVALGVFVLAIVIGIIWIGVGLRAYTRAGVLLYMFGVAAFNLWNAAVVGVSIATGYWASTQPTYHFGVSVLVGVLPLIVAAYVVGRR
jgi:hypothetical protein